MRGEEGRGGPWAPNNRPLLYNLQIEKTIAAIHYLYQKMLEHWINERVYRNTLCRSQEKHVNVARHLYQILGEIISDIIIIMSAELQRYYKPLILFEMNVVLVRLHFGVNRDQSGIRTTDNNMYVQLIRVPEAIVTCQNIQEMQKFEYRELSRRISEEKKDKY